MSRSKFWVGFGFGVVIGLSMFVAVRSYPQKQCVTLSAGMVTTTF